MDAADAARLADGLLQKMTAALAGGKYPDVVYQFGPNVANLARSPKAVDLTEDVKDPALELGRTSSRAARDAVTVDGKVRAIPALIDSMAVVYNKKLFEQAGASSRRSAGWTWDDYRATAKKLTDAGAGSSAPAGPASATRTPCGGSGRWSGARAATCWPRTARASATTASRAALAGDGRRRWPQDDKSVYIDKTVGSEKMYQRVQQRPHGDGPDRAVAAARHHRRQGRLRRRADADVRRRRR